MTLGLAEGLLDVSPTTAYLLTYCPEKCLANCFFCPQARTSRSRSDLLSRVNWPAFSLEEFISALVKNRKLVKRVCVQAVNYPDVVEDIMTIISRILSNTVVDISVCCQPLGKEGLHRLLGSGVDRIAIPLDAATPTLFSRVKGISAKGPYTWQGHVEALRAALAVFGSGRVTTHAIVGLGETDLEMLNLVQVMVDMSVYPALFAFTPIRGTKLEDRRPPPLARYRRIQTGRFLIVKGVGRVENMKFDLSGALVDFGISLRKLVSVIASGLPYVTSGCPDCNRPFYNERPGGPVYNYPRPMTPSEIEKVMESLERYCYG